MLPKKLRQLLFHIDPKEATFAVRGFQAEDNVRDRLEQVGLTFLKGYHIAIGGKSIGEITAELEKIPSHLCGFGYEGAAMGLAIRDFLPPWNAKWLQQFLQGSGSSHIYMIHVGIGWWYARLKRPLSKLPAHLDPLLGWLTLDGYGFHEGYFHWPHYVTQQKIPTRLSGYAQRVFDQGLGRSLWFVKGANIGQIAQTIQAFQPHRHADLWAGVGLACAYAGGASAQNIQQLKNMAGEQHRLKLAQGAAFAAKTRLRANNLTDHTETACQVLCGVSASQAAYATDLALAQLPPDGDVPAYEVWRQRIQQHFA